MALNARRCQILGIAGFIVFAPLILCLYLAIKPILSSIHQANIDSQLVLQLKAIASEKNTYTVALNEARDSLSATTELYTSNSEELAGGELQNGLQSLLIQFDGHISSSAILPPRDGPGPQRISVSISFTLPLEKLPSFLAAIDKQKPFLFTESMDVRTDNSEITPNILIIQAKFNALRRNP